MSTFFLHTLGCQMNVYDSERLLHSLTTAGWVLAPEWEAADLLLVNTCTVRQLAEEKAFSLVGRWSKLKQRRPRVLIGMVGCLAQHLGPSAFRRAPDIDFLAGPRALTRVPDLAARAGQEKRLTDFSVQAFGPGAPPPSGPPVAASAYVAAMDGCDQYCTYCAVPLARGREKSRSVNAILAEVSARVAAGTKEIILLGQSITRYGRDSGPGEDLAGLLRHVAKVPGISRLRFLTSHPAAFTDRLLDAMRELPVVSRTLHLPLQSGSDAVLQAMNRGYTTGYYLALVRRLRQALPDLVLSTDLIVGFPGEGEVDFQATLDILVECDFDTAFCFKFSPRLNTAAAKMPGQISIPVKESRLARLMDVVEANAIRRRAAFVGRREKVLIERMDRKTGERLQGRTRANHIVNLDGPAAWIGRELDVDIIAAGRWSLLGEIPRPAPASAGEPLSARPANAGEHAA